MEGMNERMDGMRNPNKNNKKNKGGLQLNQNCDRVCGGDIRGEAGDGGIYSSCQMNRA